MSGVEPAGADGTDACCAEAVTMKQLAINAAAAQPRAPSADRPMPLLDARYPPLGGRSLLWFGLVGTGWVWLANPTESLS